MYNYISKLLPALALLAAIPAAAQTPFTPTVTQLDLERVLTPNTTFVVGNLNVPQSVIDGVTSGALQIRERLIYNPPGTANPVGATLTSNIIVVPTSVPSPTPASAVNLDSVLGVYAFGVEKTHSVTSPSPAVAFTGTVTSATGNGILGNIAGLPFAVTLAYAPESAAADAKLKVSELVEVIAGKAVSYSKDVVGTFVVTRPPTPPTPGTGPQIVIVAPVMTVDFQITLDGSGTTDASGTPLTYVWRTIGKSGTLLNANTSRATFQFGEGFGDYVFELTVTNGNGISASKTVTVTYLGR